VKGPTSRLLLCAALKRYVEMQPSAKTILNYLTKPLYKSSEAMHERKAPSRAWRENTGRKCRQFHLISAA